MCGTSVDTLQLINAGIGGFFQGFACENDTVPTGRATLVQVVSFGQAIAIADEQYLLGHRNFLMIVNTTILDGVGRKMFGMLGLLQVYPDPARSGTDLSLRVAICHRAAGGQHYYDCIATNIRRVANIYQARW